MSKIKRIIVTTVVCIISAMSMGLDLPPPPAGFTWEEASEIKGAFLKPNGWHFKKHQNGKTQGYFITKENIDDTGHFTTGTTINVVPNVATATGRSPTEFARGYIGKAASSNQVLKKPWSHNMGPFNSYGVVLLNPDLEGGDYNTHHLVIANDATGTVYIVIYEAPSIEWDRSWKVGEKILGKLYIDSDV